MAGAEPSHDAAVGRFARGSIELLVARRASGGDPGLAARLESEYATLRSAFAAAVEDLPLGAVAAAAGLSATETELLGVLVAAEHDEALQELIVSLTGDRDRHRIEVGMLAALGLDAALAGPGARLQCAALVEVGGRGAWGRAQLRVAPRVLWHLAGDPASDPALEAPLHPLTAMPGADGWASVLVTGPDRTRRRQTAIFALGTALTLAGTAPQTDAGWAALVREATLAGAGVIVESGGGVSLTGRRWIERATHLRWALASEVRLRLDDLPRRDWRELAAPTDAPGPEEWAHVLGPDVEQTHHLTAAQLDTMALAMAVTGRDPVASYKRLTDAKLDQLATHITPRSGWDDLVLSPGRKGRLRDLVNRYRQAGRVYDDWGFAASPSRGVVALFSGPSGTGKTLSAEVVAGELGLDLYRLDLSSVVSKYVGETEKNLDELFDAAGIGNTVLFFDEADSLFGKRTEVKDSHDRYANVGTSYLLQRLERYDGVVVLCTNYEKNIDQAFLRRVHVRLDFAMPSEAERAELWRRNLTSGAPLADDLDLEFLVHGFDLSGAGIRNAVVDAAFLAAAGDGVIAMEHLVRGVARELQKLGRMVNESQFGRWYAAAVATTDG